MILDISQYMLGGASGFIVGITLSAIGGGGSILAVPLMVHLVGVANPHVAIGTSALAVAASAASSLYHHACARTVNWRCGAIFAMTGSLGALAGSAVGKSINGHLLLLLFALLMIVVAGVMIWRSRLEGIEGATCNIHNVPKVAGYGTSTGVLSGFFGIGGGFLIVPALVTSTRMPMRSAVGTSLVAVTVFGLTTSVSYAWSSLVAWRLAAVFLSGSVFGSWIGMKIGFRLTRGPAAARVFGMILLVVAAYMVWKGIEDFGLACGAIQAFWRGSSVNF